MKIIPRIRNRVNVRLIPVESIIAKKIKNVIKHSMSYGLIFGTVGAAFIVWYGIGPGFWNGVASTLGTISLLLGLFFGLLDYLYCS